jgi:hypothetical protein
MAANIISHEVILAIQMCGDESVADIIIGSYLAGKNDSKISVAHAAALTIRSGNWIALRSRAAGVT